MLLAIAFNTKRGPGAGMSEIQLRLAAILSNKLGVWCKKEIASFFIVYYFKDEVSYASFVFINFVPKYLCIFANEVK